MKTLQRDLENLDSSVDDIDSSLGGTLEQIAKLEKSLSDLDDTVDEVSERVHVLEDRNDKKCY